jgi:hypothetical protein
LFRPSPIRLSGKIVRCGWNGRSASAFVTDQRRKMRETPTVKRASNTANPQVNTVYTSRLPSDFNQTLRQSFTKALSTYYPPLDEIPPSLCELLTRLETRDV